GWAVRIGRAGARRAECTVVLAECDDVCDRQWTWIFGRRLVDLGLVFGLLSPFGVELRLRRHEETSIRHRTRADHGGGLRVNGVGRSETGDRPAGPAAHPNLLGP